MDSISHVKDKRVKKIFKKNKKSGEVKRKLQKSKIKKKKWTQRRSKGMIYLGHIPHGFYEEQMTSYFNQFGKVLKAVVARSKRTGRSKGYGFVEFADEDVAKIAAETMNNYLMYNRIIKCRYISPEERKGSLFVRTVKEPYDKAKNRKVDAKLKNEHLQKLTADTYKKKTQKKIKELKKFFEERGIDFSFKVNEENQSEEDKSKLVEKSTTKSDTSRDSESEDDTDDQFGVLEIDESDTEIHFKTPPQVKKVIKRSQKSRAIPQSLSPGRKKKKISKVKNLDSNEIQQNISKIKSKKKSNVVSPKMLKSKSQESVEVKPKVLSKGIGGKFAKKDVTKKKSTLKKSFKAKKNETVKAKFLAKGNSPVVGQKKKKKVT